MSAVVDEIPVGEGLHLGLEAVCARHRVQTGRAVLNGALAHADLVAAPDAAPVALVGPLCLVNATVRVGAERHEVWGVVSWSDRGQPRMAAGRIEDGVSAGLEVVLERWDDAVESAPPPPPRPKRAPKPKPKRAAKPKPAEPDDPHIDLSTELAELEPAPPPPAPEPAKVAASGGWGAAVAASARKPVVPVTTSDLGFDADGPPDLMTGDILLHPRFGRCRVMKVVGRKVKVRRPTGGYFDLRVDVCTFSRQSDEDGKRVFRLKIGR